MNQSTLKGLHVSHRRFLLWPNNEILHLSHDKTLFPFQLTCINCTLTGCFCGGLRLVEDCSLVIKLFQANILIFYSFYFGFVEGIQQLFTPHTLVTRTAALTYLRLIPKGNFNHFLIIWNYWLLLYGFYMDWSYNYILFVCLFFGLFRIWLIWVFLCHVECCVVGRM